jgi:hypothetical protein
MIIPIIICLFVCLIIYILYNYILSKNPILTIGIGIGDENKLTQTIDLLNYNNNQSVNYILLYQRTYYKNESVNKFNNWIDYLMNLYSNAKKNHDQKIDIDLINIPKSIKKVNCDKVSLKKIPESFCNFESLHCYCCGLNNTSWPPNINTLDCSNNNITSLDNLPEKLEYLDCSYNNITSLDNLSTLLEKLICSNNKICFLDKLPENLDYLDCTDNNIVELNNLPLGLTKLICKNNKIRCLKNLPHNLRHLDCTNNDIIELDNLPVGLIELICDKNKINSLNNLPHNLLILSCSNNPIKDLSNLPVDLKYLSVCENNIVEDIDNLPLGLEHLIIQSNANLKYVSVPKTIKILYCSENYSLKKLVFDKKCLNFYMFSYQSHRNNPDLQIIYPSPNYFNLSFYIRTLFEWIGVILNVVDIANWHGEHFSIGICKLDIEYKTADLYYYKKFMIEFVYMVMLYILTNLFYIIYCFVFIKKLKFWN